MKFSELTRQREIGVLAFRGLKDADLSDPQDNFKRAVVLDCLRGYSRRIWLFSKFPTDTAWKRVKLTPRISQV